MAKTLLNSVNEVLKRVGVISGDTQALSSLTSSAIQRDIDVLLQVINEGLEELYSHPTITKPNQQAESSIAMVTGTRAYTLASDLVRLRWPLIDKTNNQTITEFPGGYNAILLHDPEQDDTGLAIAAAIRPTDGKLYLDRAPTAVENGNTYTYQYEKELAVTVLTDTFPFSDTVWRAMVPVWAEMWKRDRRGAEAFDGGLYLQSMGRALRLVSQQQGRASWLPG